MKTSNFWTTAVVAMTLTTGCMLGNATPSMVLPSTSNATRNITTTTGTVTDQDGEPVTGATVLIKGTSTGTSTDFDGKFTINAKPGDTLVISYIGCDSQEVPVGNKPLSIVMSTKAELLDEVVVVGFGTQKKVNLTGSVGIATAEDLRERPVANATQALQGLVPGLNIEINSGSLENTPSINVRGGTTIGEGSSGNPLILIDGMEADINSVNPQDIESISVLKDAAASSIYGSRAPFGVILITTKSGSKDGKTTINYNNSFRFSNPINKKHMMNSVMFASWINDALTTGGGQPRFNEAYMARVVDWHNARPLSPGQRITDDGRIIYSVEPNAAGQWNGGFSTGCDDIDYYDVVYKDWNFSQEHNVSASGGNEKLNYYASGSYYGNDGQLNIGDENLKRFTATAKINSQITPWLRLNMNMRFTRQDYTRPADLVDYMYEAMAFKSWPVLPLYDRNGYYVHNDGTSVANLADGGTDKRQTDNYYLQTGLKFEPIKNWNTYVDFSYRVKNQTRHWDQQVIYNHDINGSPYVVHRNNSNVHEELERHNYYNFNARTEYSLSIADSHNFHILGGFQAEDMKYQTFGVQRNGILISTKPEIDTTPVWVPMGHQSHQRSTANAKNGRWQVSSVVSIMITVDDICLRPTCAPMALHASARDVNGKHSLQYRQAGILPRNLS